MPIINLEEQPMSKATMTNVFHWRTKIREAERALSAALRADLPPGTRVSYTHGRNEITVRIIEHYDTYSSYVKVENVKNGRQYLLDYARIDRIVR